MAILKKLGDHVGEFLIQSKLAFIEFTRGGTICRERKFWKIV